MKNVKSERIKRSCHQNTLDYGTMPAQARGNDRHPLEAKAVGVLQHGRLKINIFSILWSDHNDIMIYRKYEDFKNLNRELRRKFPLESGLLRKSDNMIPKLRDVPIFRINRKTIRFMKRLRLLEEYSKQLLRADEKIARCDTVTAFFTPTSSDLNPNFPQNCVMIMPSEQGDQQRERLPKPPSMEPIVSHTYLCIEDHDTKDTKNRPFKVKRNEHLGVLIKENSGWWLVENEEKRVAWFPAPFLKALETEEDQDSGTDDEGIRYYSAMAYEAMSWDEVSIPRGVLLEVIEKSNNGWWLIRYNGKTGFVPAMYLKPYRNCHQLQIMKTQGKFPSTSNMFKASSEQELNRPTEAWGTNEEYNGSKSASVAQKLEKRKSRSISGLPSMPAYGLYPSTAQLTPSTPTPHSAYGLYPTAKLTPSTPTPHSAYGLYPTAQLTPSTPTPHAAYGLYRSTAQLTPSTHTLHAEKDGAITRKDQSREAIRKPSDESKTSDTASTTDLHRKILDEEQDLHKESKARPQAEKAAATPPPRTPLIPQRPKPHEILHKCTTVTKKAFVMKEASAMEG